MMIYVIVADDTLLRFNGRVQHLFFSLLCLTGIIPTVDLDCHCLALSLF